MTITEVKKQIDFDALNKFRLEKKAVIGRMKIILTIIIVAICSFVFFITNSAKLDVMPSIFICFMVGIIVYVAGYYLLIYKIRKEFEMSYRMNALIKLCSVFGNEFKYKADKTISKSDLGASGLDFSPTVVHSNDYFEGEINRVPFICVELQLKKVEPHVRRHVQTRSSFNGIYLLLALKLRKDFEVDVVDSSILDVDHIYKELYQRSSNQSGLAQEFLSDGFMLKLDEFHHKINARTSFTIRNGNVYMAINDSTDHFYIDVNKSSEELFESHYKDLLKIRNMIKEVIDFFIPLVSPLQEKY